MPAKLINQGNQINSILETLSGFGVLRRYRGGNIITFQGDDPCGLYLLKSGFVKVYSSDEEGTEVIYRIQGAGSIFGELAVLDDLPRSATVAALQDCQLLYISTSEFKRLLHERPELALQMLSRLSVRIRQLSETLVGYVSGSVYQRLKRLLEEMASRQNQRQAMPVAMRHRDLAGLLGASREMVTKLLNSLKNSGYIKIENKVIYLVRALPARFPG